jgi:hypothetical protein
MKTIAEPNKVFQERNAIMNRWLLALAVVLAIAGTASAQYVVPEVVTSYYPPVYAPAPYAAPAPVAYSAYYAPSAYYSYSPVVVARPRVAYMPVAPTVVAAPPVYAAQPVVVSAPVVVRSKVYYPGQPVRNTVRYLVP